MAEEETIEIAWLVEFPTYTPPADLSSAPVRFWSGEGDLDFDAGDGPKTWAGTAIGDLALVQVAPIQDVRQGTPSRTVVRILIGSDAETLRALITRADPGPLPIKVHFLYRPAGSGDAWTRLNRSRLGRLSGGKISHGAYEFEIESYSGDIDRQRPEFWSHESQIAAHPGDKFFAYAADLAQGKDIRWPT